MEDFIDKKGNKLNVDDHVFVFDLSFENEQSVTFGRVTRFEKNEDNDKNYVILITECSFDNPLLHDSDAISWKLSRTNSIFYLRKMTIADVIEAFELIRVPEWPGKK